MKLSDLADVEFVNADPDDVKAAIFADYKEITGRTLVKGDPTRLFLLVITEAFVRLLNKINYAGKMNLLKYAEKEHLDHLGVFFDTPRLEAEAAITTIKVTLSSPRERDTEIPQGTRISNGDDIYFALSEGGVVPAGQTEILLPAMCLQTGDIGNDYMAGEISTIVDPIPYVTSMSNTTKTEGGSEREEDDHYKDRISEAPEKLSTAGSSGAYRYWAMTASSLISDVRPYGPKESPGTVELYVLLENGGIPEEEMLKKVLESVSADNRRPLTDRVIALPPLIVEYDLNVEYYILTDADMTATVNAAEKAVEEYVLWQKKKLGRDINPVELIGRLKAISGVKRVNIISPDFTVLNERQVAVAKDVRLTMIGREDE